MRKSKGWKFFSKKHFWCTASFLCSLWFFLHHVTTCWKSNVKTFTYSIIYSFPCALLFFLTIAITKYFFTHEYYAIKKSQTNNRKINDNTNFTIILKQNLYLLIQFPNPIAIIKKKKKNRITNYLFSSVKASIETLRFRSSMKGYTPEFAQENWMGKIWKQEPSFNCILYR